MRETGWYWIEVKHTEYHTPTIAYYHAESETWYLHGSKLKLLKDKDLIKVNESQLKP